MNNCSTQNFKNFNVGKCRGGASVYSLVPNGHVQYNVATRRIKQLPLKSIRDFLSSKLLHRWELANAVTKFTARPWSSTNHVHKPKSKIAFQVTHLDNLKQHTLTNNKILK
jgi:hypothetical protein